MKKDYLPSISQVILNLSLTLVSCAVLFGGLMISNTPELYAQGVVPQTCSGPDCEFGDFMQLIINVVNFLVQVGIAFAAIIFAYAGWLYMTSGGDSGKISKAHELFIKVLWGFLFALGAYLIVRLIASSLGLKASVPIMF